MSLAGHEQVDHRIAWVAEGTGGAGRDEVLARSGGDEFAALAGQHAVPGASRARRTEHAVPSASSGGTLPPPSATPEAAASSLVREGALESTGVEGDEGDAPLKAAGDVIGTRDEGGREGVRGASP